MVENTCPREPLLIHKRPADILMPQRREDMAKHRCTQHRHGSCVGDGTAESFKDEESMAEYMLSGFCQACQDAFYK